MKSICSIIAVVLAFASPAEGKASAGWHAAGSHQAAGGYKLPRLPSLPPLPRLPRLPRP